MHSVPRSNLQKGASLKLGYTTYCYGLSAFLPVMERLSQGVGTSSLAGPGPGPRPWLLRWMTFNMCISSMIRAFFPLV